MCCVLCDEGCGGLCRGGKAWQGLVRFGEIARSLEGPLEYSLTAANSRMARRGTNFPGHSDQPVRPGALCPGGLHFLSTQGRDPGKGLMPSSGGVFCFSVCPLHCCGSQVEAEELEFYERYKCTRFVLIGSLRGHLSICVR